MEDKKTIFNYTGLALTIFAITILLLNVLCLLVGESAKEISTIFRLGNKGLAIETMFQFLLVSIVIAFLQFVFFTDTILKKMSLLWRTVYMVASVIAVTVVFIIFCEWFPVTMWEAWFMFFLTFGICFFVSVAVMSFKERTENKQMEEALKRIKQGEK